MAAGHDRRDGEVAGKAAIETVIVRADLGGFAIPIPVPLRLCLVPLAAINSIVKFTHRRVPRGVLRNKLHLIDARFVVLSGRK